METKTFDTEKQARAYAAECRLNGHKAKVRTVYSYKLGEIVWQVEIAE